MTFEDYLGQCKLELQFHPETGIRVLCTFPTISADRVRTISAEAGEMSLAECVSLAQMNYNNRTNKNED